MAKYDIITFADTCIDILVSGQDVTPQFGQVEKLVDNYSLELGGSCCLFAAQAAKLGLKVAVLGRVGADAFGQLVIDKLEAAGVDTRYLTVDASIKTGMTVHLTPTGSNDRAMLTYLGSLAAVSPADVTDEFLQSGRHLHYASLFLHTQLIPVWGDIIKRAKGFGLTTSLDTNYDPSEQWDAGLSRTLSDIDILMPNEQEARLIAHQPTLDEALIHLRERVNLLTLKLGAEGAQVYSPQATYAHQPPPAERGGDTTGAGDAFDAGFLAGWLSGLPLETCLQIGCECGRSVAGSVGGYAGQLWRRDVSNLTP